MKNFHKCKRNDGYYFPYFPCRYRLTCIQMTGDGALYILHFVTIVLNNLYLHTVIQFEEFHVGTEIGQPIRV